MENQPRRRDDAEIDLERDTVPIRGGDADLDTADSLAEPVPTPADGPLAVTTRHGGGGRRVWFERSSSWYWPSLGLVGLLVVIGVNFLANWLPFNDQTTDDVLTNHPNPFQPAGWSFLLWGVVYALMAVFVVYSLLPGGRRSRRIGRIEPLFLIANIANILWLIFWHWEQFTLALVFIVILLLSLLLISFLAHQSDVDGNRPTRFQILMLQIPFSVYLAWASVMTLTNIMVWLSDRGWDSGPFSLRVWAVIFVIIGLLVAAAFAAFRHDAAFPLVFVWSYIAITQEQWDGNKLVAIFAGIGAVAAAALTVMAFMLSFDRRAMTGTYSEAHREDPLPIE